MLNIVISISLALVLFTSTQALEPHQSKKHGPLVAPHEEKNLIEQMTVRENKLEIIPHPEFKKNYLKGNFFAHYDSDINLERFDYSIQSMPFIMNVISIVWISGEIYYIDEMDAELYDSLERVKRVFKKMYPGTSWEGELRPRKLINHPIPFPVSNSPERTALLYSGGIDSTSTAFAHLDKKQLLITAWGHWDLPLHEESLWQTRKKKIISFAQQWGNDTSFIRSNYSSFLNWEYLSNLTPEILKWRLGAVEGLGWAGLTAPILLSKQYPILRIASSHTWLYPYPSAASPFVDNNLKFCGLRLLHDQFDMTRLDKIAFICRTCKEQQIEPPFLKICSLEKKSDANCGNCRKCLSSAIGFLAINENPQKYGIKIDTQAAVARTLKLLEPKKLNFYTILFFKEIQKTILNRLDRGLPVPQEILVLLKIDFDQKIAYDIEKQHKLDWKKMLDLLPDKSNLPLSMASKREV